MFAGDRVIVDASFAAENHRRQFVEAGRRWGVPVLFMLCEAPSSIVKSRLDARHGDVSDADWSIHVEAAKHWESPAPETARVMGMISTGRSPEDAETQGWNALHDAGLISDACAAEPRG